MHTTYGRVMETSYVWMMHRWYSAGGQSCKATSSRLESRHAKPPQLTSTTSGTPTEHKSCGFRGAEHVLLQLFSPYCVAFSPAPP
jgi:hypothetical protein